MLACSLLGAITPYHVIDKLPPTDYRRYTATKENREILARVHGR